jgi:hypothetical protein
MAWMRGIATGAVLAAAAAPTAAQTGEEDLRTRLERWAAEGRALADEAATEAEQVYREAEQGLDALQLYLEGEATALRDLTDEGVAEFLDELARTEALIGDAGYRLERIDVAPARLVPEIVLHARFERALSEAEAADLLARIEGDGVVPSLQRLIIDLLLRASAYNQDVDLAGFRLDTVRVFIGLPPGVRLVYLRE